MLVCPVVVLLYDVVNPGNKRGVLINPKVVKGLGGKISMAEAQVNWLESLG